ncbi:swr1 complex component [Dinochytrium kinnereticum]|nr:swr1 complex component [Dinochytrium kinnereticum]
MDTADASAEVNQSASDAEQMDSSTSESEDFFATASSDDSDGSYSAPEGAISDGLAVSRPSISLRIPVPLSIRNQIFANKVNSMLSSFISMDDEEISQETANERAKKDAVFWNRVSALQNSGYLTGFTIENLRPRLDPQMRKSHRTILMEEMKNCSAGFMDARKYRISSAKRVAKAVLKYWELKRTEGDRHIKSEAVRLRRMAKFIAGEVFKKWKVIDSIIQAKRKEIMDQENKKAGKRHLDAIIEKSTHILNEVQQSIMTEQTYIDTPDNHSEASFMTNIEDFDGAESSESDSEVNKLEAEKDMPLEELLKRYGYMDRPIDFNPATPLSSSDSDDSFSSVPDDNMQDDGTVEDMTPDILANVVGSPKSDTNRTALGMSCLSIGPLEPLETDDSNYDLSQSDLSVSEDGITTDEDVEAGNVEVQDLLQDADLDMETLLDMHNMATASSVDEDVHTFCRSPPLPVEAVDLDDYFAHALEEDMEESDEDADDEDDEESAESEVEEKGDEGLLGALYDDTSLPMEVSEETEEAASNGVTHAMEVEEALNDVSEVLQTESRQQSTVGSPHPDSENGAMREVNEEETTNAQENAEETVVKTRVPFLLKFGLRIYQHVGLDWLVNLYNNGLNGILADEMGLGKTIQTIALIAYLAVEKAVWGPHLIVVPTSVMLNWELEFKKWCPGLKILTYYGSPSQRKEKRSGWSKPNAFHVCITSYQLVLADQVAFRRKPWIYLVLDEAHNIKNFRSQKWQVLLTFNSQRRLLLTGTPLQNNLMELWSLLYFLMPNGVANMMPAGFATLKEFQEWFSRPVDKVIEESKALDDETKATIQKLHTVLRPYILRRLKSEVEKQMPKKYEHVLTCRLSTRQRFLYDDFMSRAKTKEALSSGNYLSIINCLMQLRKVCNHPDLFEERPVVTSFAMKSAIRIDLEIKDLLMRRKMLSVVDSKSNSGHRLRLVDLGEDKNLLHLTSLQRLDADRHFDRTIFAAAQNEYMLRTAAQGVKLRPGSVEAHQRAYKLRRSSEVTVRWCRMRILNRFRMRRMPIYGESLFSLLRNLGSQPVWEAHTVSLNPRRYLDYSNALAGCLLKPEDKLGIVRDVVDRFAFVTPKVIAQDAIPEALVKELLGTVEKVMPRAEEDIYSPVQTKLSIAFPDKWLVRYDCGKLQQLDALLRTLLSRGSRALIFTQMTKMLDILERFLNVHGYLYVRLDGSTKPEQRQMLMDRFNNDKRIFVFILSTRSGGVGMNLTGADTVIFYDSDWNPAMDAQAQDRAHRIGQTRDVHIYRLISAHTIEENMLRKANQKRRLDSLVIQEGEFTTDFLKKKVDWKDWLDGMGINIEKASTEEDVPTAEEVAGPSAEDLEQVLALAEDETDVLAMREARKEIADEAIEFSEVRADVPVSMTGEVAPPVLDVTLVEEEGRGGEVIAAEDMETSAKGPTSAMTVTVEKKDTLKIEVGHVEEYMLRFWIWNLGVGLRVEDIMGDVGENREA